MMHHLGGASMTTANPRITVTLQPEVHAVLRRLSQLTKNSQSAIVGDLLMESLPVFERMAEVLDAAEQLRLQGLKASDEVKDALARAQGRIETQLGLAMDDMEAGGLPLLKEAEKVRRRGAAAGKRSAAAAPRSGATPLSNRGVRSGPEGSAKAVKAAK
jgi:hypothetical protein